MGVGVGYKEVKGELGKELKWVGRARIREA